MRSWTVSGRRRPRRPPARPGCGASGVAVMAAFVIGTPRFPHPVPGRENPAQGLPTSNSASRLMSQARTWTLADPGEQRAEPAGRVREADVTDQLSSSKAEADSRTSPIVDGPSGGPVPEPEADLRAI